jgi:hypothetical protein
MEYEIKNFETEGDNKRIGFLVTTNGKIFAIDRLIPVVEGKTEEAYVQDAFAAAETEINAWASDANVQLVGKKWNPETNTAI